MSSDDLHSSSDVNTYMKIYMKICMNTYMKIYYNEFR